MSPEWNLFLRNGIDLGEGAWQQFLSDEGPWMWNQVTNECFLARDGSPQWQRSICSDPHGGLVYYWHSENRWFLEPQILETTPLGVEIDCQMMLGATLGGRALMSNLAQDKRQWYIDRHDQKTLCQPARTILVH